VTVPIDKNPFAFNWLVDKQGYEWVQGEDSEPRLVARSGSHAPLRDKDRLFRKFAKLKPTRADIQKFANRFGVIFDPGVHGSVRRASGSYRVSQLQGVSLRRWKGEIERMRVLVNIWEAIKDHKKNELRRAIVWKGKDTVGYKIAWSDTLLANPHFNKHLLDRFKSLDVVKPALYLLQAEINKRIADSASPAHLAIVPRLVWCPGPRVDGIAKPDHHQRIIFQPTNLLAAMWLQFAQAVTEEYQLQTCKGCGEYFQIGKGARRSDTETCSTRCRKRFSRYTKKSLR
jgi:hypothetical protein